MSYIVTEDSVSEVIKGFGWRETYSYKNFGLIWKIVHNLWVLAVFVGKEPPTKTTIL